MTVPALQDDSCYTEVIVSSTSGPGGTDERQNFANWFSFYRTRNLTTNTSANIAFTGLNSSYRVAWRDLNTCSAFNTTSCKGWSNTPYDNRIATFTGTHRTNFFDWLQHFPANGRQRLCVLACRASATITSKPASAARAPKSTPR